MYQKSGIGLKKEKSKMLKTNNNVDPVGHSQLLVQLKPVRLFKIKPTLKTILNKCWLIVIIIATTDAKEAGQLEHMKP